MLYKQYLKPSGLQVSKVEKKNNPDACFANFLSGKFAYSGWHNFYLFAEAIKQKCMTTDNTGNTAGNDNTAQSAASTGNASNPSPQADNLPSPEQSQLLNEKAEKYLRESASIEDLPDAQDEAEMDKTLKKGNAK